MSGPAIATPEALRTALQPLQATWAGLAQRERRLVRLAAWVLGLFLLWSVALQPAWRTLRSAPAKLDELDQQLQAMQVQAVDVRTLRATPPLPRAQASAALQAATQRLGTAGRLVEQGDRAVLTLTAVSSAQLRSWLAEVRAGARVRPVDVNLTRGEQGLSGTVVVQLPGA